MTTLVKTLATSRLLQTLFVPGIVGAYNACGHELEGIGVQGSNGISIYGLHMVSTGLTLEKLKLLVTMQLETGFNDLQNQNL